MSTTAILTLQPVDRAARAGILGRLGTNSNGMLTCD